MSSQLAGRLERVAALAVGVSAAAGVVQLWALKAAGLNIAEPDGGGAISGIINTLQANWEWLILTGIGLALSIVFGLVVFGSQRAPEHAFRIAGGIIGIVVVIPAVLK
jgi:hypothetical protein